MSSRTTRPSHLVKDTLVYLVYGHGPHNDEAVYSVLSALHQMGPDQSDYRIVAYTDDPAALGEGLPVHVELLTAQVLADWRGPFAHANRRKILAIKHALEHFGGRVLFCDSDTWFVKHPKAAFARIRPGHTLMHVAEYHMDDRCARSYAESLAGRTFRNLAGAPWSIGPASAVFNSGVVGLHESDTFLLDEVLHLNDQLYSHARIPTTEQITTSLCLQHYTRLHQAYDVVRHYWSPKPRALFREQLSRVLHEASIPTRDQQFRQLLPHAPQITAYPFHLGRQSLGRRIRQRARASLTRAAERAGVKDQLRHILRSLGVLR